MAVVLGGAVLLPACQPAADTPAPPRMVRVRELRAAAPLFLPAPPPGPVGDAILAARAAVLNWEGDDRAALDALAGFPASREAVAELIIWLEYRPVVREEPDPPPWPPEMKSASEPDPLPPAPAQDALVRVGPLAAPQLVDEYIRFFGNTWLAPYQERMAVLEPDGPDPPAPVLRPDQRIRPDHRLFCVAWVLASSEEMARAAVADAAQKMRADPADGRLQGACRELIDRVMKEFPKEKHRALFPDAFPRT